MSQGSNDSDGRLQHNKERRLNFTDWRRQGRKKVRKAKGVFAGMRGCIRCCVVYEHRGDLIYRNRGCWGKGRAAQCNLQVRVGARATHKCVWSIKDTVGRAGERRGCTERMRGASAIHHSYQAECTGRFRGRREEKKKHTKMRQMRKERERWEGRWEGEEEEEAQCVLSPGCPSSAAPTRFEGGRKQTNKKEGRQTWRIASSVPRLWCFLFCLLCCPCLSPLTAHATRVKSATVTRERERMRAGGRGGMRGKIDTANQATAAGLTQLTEDFTRGP